MHSPCIIVSQYKYSNSSVSPPENTGLRSSTANCWLTNNGCRLPEKSAGWEQRTPQASQDDLSDVMGLYRDLLFEFTFPETIDFQDLEAGMPASTQRSLMVVEYGAELYKILSSLRAAQVAPECASMRARGIVKVETSIESLRFWIEEQRAIQLMQEGGAEI